jgi:cell division protein FtsB
MNLNPLVQEVERHASMRAVLWIGPLAALLGAAVALFYDADNGLRAVFHLQRELDVADLRLDRLREERAALLLRALRLRSDPFEIESVARESLGMARPGELVVRLPRPPAPAERPSD